MIDFFVIVTLGIEGVISMKILKNAISIIAAIFILLVAGQISYAQSLSKTNVDPHDDWTITFKEKLDIETIHADNIFVKQDSQYVKSIQIIPNADQKSVTVKAPPKGYAKGESYTLYILNSIKFANGVPLKNQITMEFTIKNDDKVENHFVQQAVKSKNNNEVVEIKHEILENDFEYEVFELVNEVRAKHNLPPLLLYNELSSVAREKSKDLMVGNYFDHNSPTYGSPFDMMKKFGITYRTAGENIAGGFDTSEEVMDGWMDSPGHRANILNPSYTHIGVGYVSGGGKYGTYWTQMFVGLK